MLKKLTAVLLSAFIVVLTIPFIKSNADTIVVPEDENGKFYLYNHVDFSTWSYDDFLTVNNYDLYFNDLSGDEKTKFNNFFVDDIHNTQSYFKKIIYGLMNPNLSGANNIWLGGFKIDDNYIPFEDCKISCAHVNLDSDAITFTLTYSPSNTPIIVSGNTLYSEQPFYMRYSGCNFGGGGTLPDDNEYYNFSNFSAMNNESYQARYDSTNNFYYWSYQGYPFNGYFYADDIVLFTGYTNNYPDLDDTVEAYNGYKNNNSLCVDRRTIKFIDKINSDNDDNSIINDADLMNFKGELGFESFVFKGYIDKNADLVFPSYVVNYKYNNYTDLRKDNVLLYVDYSFDFKLTFNMAGGTVGYQSVDMQNMSVEDITDNRTAFGGDLNGLISQSRFINVRETSGLHLQSNDIVGYEDISQFQSTSLIANLGRYFYKIMNNPTANHVVNSKRDSYFYIYIDFYLVDNTDGIRQESKHIKRRIDYWGDSNDPNSILKTPAINDVDNSGIIDDDKAFQDFIDSYNSNNTSEDSGYINYLPSVNNGGSTSSIGNITINQNPYPYLLVDIPEGEWMSKTPNLTTILTDFKDALSEVKNNSILNVMSETYNYLPVPVWQYFTYGVGILIAIGIWRAITRR